MYVLPRGLESAWSVMRRRGWVPIVPGGENLLCAVGMSMVMVSLALESVLRVTLMKLGTAGYLSGESSGKNNVHMLIYSYRQAPISCRDSFGVYCTNLLAPIDRFPHL